MGVAEKGMMEAKKSKNIDEVSMQVFRSSKKRTK